MFRMMMFNLASFVIIGYFGTLGIIRLTNLVFKVMSTSSLYQRKLNKILREYDKYIVLKSDLLRRCWEFDRVIEEYQNLSIML